MSSGRSGGRRGRGAYYKAKYGSGRGRGTSGHEAGAPHQDQHQHQQPLDSHPIQQLQQAPRVTQARDWPQLARDLTSIDGQQYGAYKQLLGRYTHDGPRFTLYVDHVQGDAYASPSRVRAVMPWTETGIPIAYIRDDARKIAVGDFVTRVAAALIQEKHLDHNVGGGNGGWSGPKGGAFSINNCGQEILPRTSAIVCGDETIELRFTVALPAAGRTILGQQAYNILGVNLVEVVRRSLLFSETHKQHLLQHILSNEQQTLLRQEMTARDLVAFVANGSILPRASGSSQAPMKQPDAVSFRSPPELEITLSVTGDDGVTSLSGMGIPRGVTVLTGGGFHGKSTLLEAVELGVYNHIPTDGREQIVTEPTAAKIRAEDGRCVSMVDVSPFISALPGGKSNTMFSTENASGSTSMAANIQEALEVGCKLLLIDEDSSATNLLVRDQRMQALIRNEPITPLISKARALFDQHGVSTIIVVGGLGDWLTVADHVIAMESYLPRYMNNEAQAVVQQFPSTVPSAPEYGSFSDRAFQVNFSGHRSPWASRKRFISVKPQTRSAVDDPSQEENGIDLSALDQVVEIGQSRMIATLLQHIEKITATEGPIRPRELVERLQHFIGVDRCLPSSLTGGDLVAVRLAELAAALFRIRGMVDVHPQQV